MKLETRRLILRKPRLSDWKDVVEGVSPLRVSRYLAVVPHPYKRKDAEWFIKHSIKRWKQKEQTEWPFFIELKSEKKIIGVISIKSYDKQNKICETGSWVNKKYWRKGYITEAKIAVNEFAFNKLKVRKMETGVYNKNVASNATQKAIGYEYEGTRLKHHIVKSTGKIYDEHLYGLMKKDWKKNLPKLRKKLNEKIKKLEKNETPRPKGRGINQ
jgi:RimJ/RimL family protein N-acetyltransferase